MSGPGDPINTGPNGINGKAPGTCAQGPGAFPPREVRGLPLDQQDALYAASVVSTLLESMMVNPVWIFGVTVPPSSAAMAWFRPCVADVARLLRDERLNGAVLQRLDLVGAGVEADDLDLRPSCRPAGCRWPSPRPRTGWWRRSRRCRGPSAARRSPASGSGRVVVRVLHAQVVVLRVGLAAVLEALDRERPRWTCRGRRRSPAPCRRSGPASGSRRMPQPHHRRCRRTPGTTA